MSIQRIVLFASHAYSVLNFRRNLINDLDSLSFEIHVVVPKTRDIETINIVRKIEKLGATVHKVYLNRSGLNPILDCITFLQIIKVFWKIKPTHILSYTIKPVIYGSLAAKILGIKRCFALITGLGFVFYEQPGLKHRILRAMVSFLYMVGLHGAQKVIFQNPDDLELFSRLKIVEKSKSYIVNGSGVDLDFYKFSESRGEISFLMLSRLLHSKGVGVYFKAAKKVKTLFPDVRFMLVGGFDDSASDTISKAELESYTGDNVIDYYGALSDVRQVITDCSVFILPVFYREGTPRSILEAMSIGRAIITTDVPGCRETVVNGENGYLVEPKSVSELVDSMLRLLKDPNMVTSMGIKSRKIAEEKYDVRKVNLRMLKIMEITK